MEFSSGHSYMKIRNWIYQLITSGYKPIIAHVERYPMVTDKMEKLEELIAALEQESAAVVTGETMETTEETTAPTGETTEPTEKTTVPTTAPAAPGPTAPAPEEDGAGEEEEETEETTETTAPSTFTVTFQYNGVAFATQTVTSGNTAAKPTLQPTPSGTWEGLDTPITGDTTISWIAN